MFGPGTFLASILITALLEMLFYNMSYDIRIMISYFFHHCSKGPAPPAVKLLPLPSAVTFKRKSPGIWGLGYGFVMPEGKLRAVKPVALAVQGVVWNLERVPDRHGPLHHRDTDLLTCSVNPIKHASSDIREPEPLPPQISWPCTVLPLSGSSAV